LKPLSQVAPRWVRQVPDQSALNHTGSVALISFVWEGLTPRITGGQCCLCSYLLVRDPVRASWAIVLHGARFWRAAVLAGAKLCLALTRHLVRRHRVGREWSSVSHSARVVNRATKMCPIASTARMAKKTAAWWVRTPQRRRRARRRGGPSGPSPARSPDDSPSRGCGGQTTVCRIGRGTRPFARRRSCFSAGVARFARDDPFAGSGSATGQVLTWLREDSAAR
jgi:hypothetical protein